MVSSADVQNLRGGDTSLPPPAARTALLILGSFVMSEFPGLLLKVGISIYETIRNPSPHGRRS